MGSERLPFKALINKDPNHAAMIAQSIREYNYDKQIYIKRIQNMSEKNFASFCHQIMRWQDFTYQLRGTVGTELKDNIPPDQNHLFKQYVFNENRTVELFEEDDNDQDPGIIIQKCLRSNSPREQLTHYVRVMSGPDFKDFCSDIELLAYFVATQDGNYFSHFPELIPRGHEHFWFND